MITFSHVIEVPQGLHARPVASIASCLTDAASRARVRCGDMEADASDLLGLMGLDGRRGQELRFTVEGPDEEAVAERLRAVCAREL